MKNLSIRLRLCNHFLVHQNQAKPSHRIIRRIRLKENLLRQRMKNSYTEIRQVRNGKLTIQTRRDTMELLQNFLSTLKRAKRQNLSQATKMSGNPTLMGPVRISMRPWLCPAHRQVNCCSTRSEETSETISRIMICLFLR